MRTKAASLHSFVELGKGPESGQGANELPRFALDFGAFQFPPRATRTALRYGCRARLQTLATYRTKTVDFIVQRTAPSQMRDLAFPLGVCWLSAG